jgi:hypothetical protein
VSLHVHLYAVGRVVVHAYALRGCVVCEGRKGVVVCVFVGVGGVFCVFECVKLLQGGGRYTRLAQSVERWPFKPVVVGSSPTGGACFFAIVCQHASERVACASGARSSLCSRVGCSG